MCSVWAGGGGVGGGGGGGGVGDGAGVVCSSLFLFCSRFFCCFFLFLSFLASSFVSLFANLENDVTFGDLFLSIGFSRTTYGISSICIGTYCALIAYQSSVSV